MDLQSVAAIGELVGAMGVIISIIYLARQVAHSTKVSRAQGYEALTQKLADLALAVSSHPELADAVGKVQIEHAGRDDLHPTDRIRVGYVYYATFVLGASIYERFRAGLISQADLDGWMSQNAGMMSAPYLADVWPILRPNFPEDYAQFIEHRYDLLRARIADTSPEPPASPPVPAPSAPR